VKDGNRLPRPAEPSCHGFVALGRGQPSDIWSTLIVFGAGASYFARGINRAVSKLHAESPQPPKLILSDSFGKN
jgi:hypothetical protein